MTPAADNQSLSPRQRVEVALRGGHSDCVPFTMYERKVPQCAAEREMRNRGMCIVNRTVPVVKTHHPNVTITEEHSWQSGKRFVRTIYETPVGTLSSLQEMAEFTSWFHEKPFKGPDDYKALRFFLADERYEPDYAAFRNAQDASGGDAVFRAGFGLEPIQTLISGGLIDMQEFCIQWMDHRDEILKLYEVLVEKRRQVYPLVAESPALFANYGGNVTPQIIGRDSFEAYYVPHYHEAAEVMHRHGKLIGCHFDDNCALIADLIADTALDYIEAFTPAPDTDMTMAEARAAWPDKVLWINFPSSVHLKSDEEVTATTIDLLDQAGHLDGLLFGVTEDVPERRWRDSCRAIMDGLELGHAVRR